MQHDTGAALWPSLSGIEVDDTIADAEDILADLDVTAGGAASCLAAELGVTDYALPAGYRPVLSLVPRSYQVDACTAWQQQGRGVVVLPTGAGKTMVALMAIERLAVRTLVVVPTLELLAQWQRALGEQLGVPSAAVGVVGGGRRDVRDLTVITFDSAAMPQRHLDGFGLLIVDEVHHLPATQYRRIVSKVDAPCRLGLSATPERLDGRHHDLDLLIGPVVFHRLPSDLRRERQIADYVEHRVFVDLSPGEQGRYEWLMAQFRWYLARYSLRTGGDCFRTLVRRAGHDPAARQALQAHRQARMIALNAEAKIARVADLLDRHRRDKVIIFAEYTALPEWLGTLLNVIRGAGSLAESDLAQRLGCPAEEVQSHLAAIADTAGDVVYIDGFGLCTASLLAHARTLVDEETAGHAGQLDLTRLGRRLREVVGHNEGLHALIATVSGALRPVA